MVPLGMVGPFSPAPCALPAPSPTVPRAGRTWAIRRDAVGWGRAQLQLPGPSDGKHGFSLWPPTVWPPSPQRREAGGAMGGGSRACEQQLLWL